MGYRRRDPRITNNMPVPPWAAADLCPCNSGVAFDSCCLRADGAIYKSVGLGPPPGQITGLALARCYLGQFNDCSAKLSGEHYISQAVLRQIDTSGANAVRLGGLPWLKAGETRDLPIAGVQSKILCERHNHALSPLDNAAGRKRQPTDALVKACWVFCLSGVRRWLSA